MDGIEDNGHAFQFNVEQSETQTNVIGKSVQAAQWVTSELYWIRGSKNPD